MRDKKIAVVLDNARFHHAKALTDLYAPGRAPGRITPIYMPPYAPDLGSHRTRLKRRQEQYRQPPHTRPGEHLRSLHRLHHQPHLRLRLRAPPSHTTTHRSCLIPAISPISPSILQIVGNSKPDRRAHSAPTSANPFLSKADEWRNGIQVGVIYHRKQRSSPGFD